MVLVFGGSWVEVVVVDDDMMCFWFWCLVWVGVLVLVYVLCFVVGWCGCFDVVFDCVY